MFRKIEQGNNLTRENSRNIEENYLFSLNRKHLHREKKDKYFIHFNPLRLGYEKVMPKKKVVRP